jgi:ankyrin repeat protein
MIAPTRKVFYNGDMDLKEIINAALEDNTDLVSELIARGVDVNTQDRGFTAMHAACMHGNVRLADLLMRQPTIDLSIRTEDRGLLAWQFAMTNHHYELARKVAEATSPSHQQVTPLPRR